MSRLTEFLENEKGINHYSEFYNEKGDLKEIMIYTRMGGEYSVVDTELKRHHFEKKFEVVKNQYGFVEKSFTYTIKNNDGNVIYSQN